MIKICSYISRAMAILVANKSGKISECQTSRLAKALIGYYNTNTVYKDSFRSQIMASQLRIWSISLRQTYGHYHNLLPSK